MTFQSKRLWLRSIITAGIILLGLVWALIITDALIGLYINPMNWQTQIGRISTGSIMLMLVIAIYSTSRHHPRVGLVPFFVMMALLTLVIAAQGNNHIPDTPYARFLLGVAGYQVVLAFLLLLQSHCRRQTSEPPAPRRHP